ncbi:MAG: hypothetical protein HQL72_05190 [Magnetococcales bacterium]|nr:hypothetical protein [Magnetococcales bacterium]
MNTPFYPFDSGVANSLVSEWQQNRSQQNAMSVRELMVHIAACAIADPDESVYQLLDLKPYQLLKRKKFTRYYRSSQAYVWKRVLMVVHPNRVEQIMEGVDGLLRASGGGVARSGEQTRLDLLLYDEIVDNFKEEGFLSVAHQVVIRIGGDIEKKPNNLIFSVRYSDYLDSQYQLFLSELS